MQASVLAVSAFGPDRSRPPLFLQGRCRGCVSKANSRRTPATPTAVQYAAKLLRAAQEHAEVFEIPCDLSALTLLPFPPVCVLTLDDLVEGDTPQAPSLAMLVDGPGFTEENSVVISGRARRRHLVIGAKAIREHLGNADVLPALTVATLLDALLRHNRLAWAVEAVAVASEVDALTRMDTYAYIRVSTVDQNEARQVEALSGRAKRTFTDKASGKDTNRPAFQDLLATVKADDSIVVASMDRFSRSLMDLQKTVEDLVSRGVTVEFVKENLKFSPGSADPMAKLMLQTMGAFAEFERTLIRERQREGIAAAKAAGKFMGRKPVFDEAKTAKLVEYLKRGMTPMEISRQMAPISRASIYNKMAELGYKKRAHYNIAPAAHQKASNDASGA